MVDQTKVVGSRLQLYAEVAGEKYDIASYSASFEINNIPAGSAMLPVGRVLDAIGTPAEVMTKFNNFTAKQKIKIYLSVEFNPTDYGVGLAEFIGSGAKLIFEGYITGAILKRTSTSLHIVVHFVHWLSDLNNASVFSGTSHVSNPVALYDRGASVVYRSSSVGADAADAAGGCSYTSQEGHWSILATSTTLAAGSNDVWDAGFKPFLNCLLSEDSLNPKIQKWFNVDAAKEKRLNALRRINSGGLIIDPALLVSSTVAKSISKGISAGIRSTDANSTVWGLLIGYWGPSYFFAVCPRVEDAILAPLVGSNRDFYETIEANDYYSIELNLSARQSIGAVGVRIPTTLNVGIPSLSQGLSDWPGVYPVLKSFDDKYNGVFLSREMPYWLSQLAFQPPPINPAVVPVTAFTTPTGLSPKNVVEIAKLLAQQNTLAERFARFFYVNEIFNSRSCDLSGKLRFDICPGTTLQVQALALDPAVTGVDHFYGQVIRVSYTIDATQGTASTVFTLSNLRTESELLDQVYSIDKPPLYQAAWLGDTLV